MIRLEVRAKKAVLVQWGPPGYTLAGDDQASEAGAIQANDTPLTSKKKRGRPPGKAKGCGRPPGVTKCEKAGREENAAELLK